MKRADEVEELVHTIILDEIDAVEVLAALEIASIVHHATGELVMADHYREIHDRLENRLRSSAETASDD